MNRVVAASQMYCVAKNYWITKAVCAGALLHANAQHGNMVLLVDCTTKRLKCIIGPECNVGPGFSFRTNNHVLSTILTRLSKTAYSVMAVTINFAIVTRYGVC